MNPSLKNWLTEYYHHYQENKTELKLSDDISLDLYHYIRTSGILFGIPLNLQTEAPPLFDNWTYKEQYKVIFTDALFTIFDIHNKESNPQETFEKIENICEEITDFTGELENCINKYSVEKGNKILINNYNTNLWLPVLLTAFFYKLEDKIISNTYAIKYELCKILLSASISNHQIDKEEKVVFKRYINSADLKEEDEKNLLQKLKNKEHLEINIDILKQNKLLTYIAFDWALLIVLSDGIIDEKEYLYLQKLAALLDIDEKEMQEHLLFLQNNLDEIYQQLPYLHQKYNPFKIGKMISHNIHFLLKKNIGMIAQEIKESKELLQLLRKSVDTSLSAEEKEKIKNQTYDLLKTIPSLALFMAPGGSLLLPILLKILPPDLLYPSSFTNEKEKKE